MDEHERLLLDLVERLNHQLTMDEVHAAREALADCADPLRAAIGARRDDPRYADMMDALYEYARRKIRGVTDRAEAGQAGRELAAIERELLALLRDITNPDREPAAVERLRDHLGEAARGFAGVARALPERDALKCLYRYADVKSRRAVDQAHARSRERTVADPAAHRYGLDPFASHGARPDWLRDRGGDGPGRGFSR
jgi:hypothetical protein